MSDMLERAARALFTAHLGVTPAWDNTPEVREHWVAATSAVLTAIREPDGETFMAGEDVYFAQPNGDSRDIFTAMIDHILSEGEAGE